MNNKSDQKDYDVSYNTMMEVIGSYIHNGLNITTIKLTRKQYEEWKELAIYYTRGLFYVLHPDGEVTHVNYQGRKIKIKVVED